MSALGQKQTFAVQKAMSALPLKAHMAAGKSQVSFEAIRLRAGVAHYQSRFRGVSRRNQFSDGHEARRCGYTTQCHGRAGLA